MTSRLIKGIKEKNKVRFCGFDSISSRSSRKSEERENKRNKVVGDQSHNPLVQRQADKKERKIRKNETKELGSIYVPKLYGSK